MTQLTSVNLPNSVTTIAGGAFSGCTGLTSIEIPNSVISIGSSAFYGCTGLTSITIPNSVTTIGYSAFYGCTGLTSIEIPNSITSIEYETFNGCTGLTSITIPNSVTTIGSSAFSGCTGLTSIEIPDGVTSVEYAFQNCSNVSSVTIGKGVTNIRENTFAGCINIISVVWNAKNATRVRFVNPSKIESFVFGEEVEVIPDQTCENMTQLTSLNIPNSVTSIGALAFQNCSGLTSIEIPNGVTSVGSKVIYNCLNLKKVIAPAQVFDEQSTNMYTTQLDTIIITKGELTNNVFNIIQQSYKTLKLINLLATTNTILPDEAFKGHYNLQTLILPSNLETIGYMAVAECVNLQSIDIPASVEEIGQRAFENCRSLKTITFGGAQPLPVIGKSLAQAATSKLRKIGSWAFYNAHELQHLDIPEGVEEIGDAAFYGCTYLKDLVLPSSVHAIGDNCFAMCSKLKKIRVNSTTPPEIHAKTFFDVNRQIPVYVPDNYVDAYKTDTYWGEFDIQGVSNMPMAIDQTTNETHSCSQKLLQNGNVYILMHNGAKYSITGSQIR